MQRVHEGHLQFSLQNRDLSEWQPLAVGDSVVVPFSRPRGYYVGVVTRLSPTLVTVRFTYDGDVHRCPHGLVRRAAPAGQHAIV
jgi:hypothetical protein